VAKKLVQAKGALTDADVARFDAAVQKWCTLLNLGDWRVERSTKPCSKAHMAEVVRRELPHRLSSYRLNRDWSNEESITPERIDAIALHEVCHIFLHELIAFVGAPGATEEDKEAAEHRVINTLVRLLVPDGTMRKVLAALGVKP
jgi:hypothetical protein